MISKLTIKKTTKLKTGVAAKQSYKSIGQVLSLQNMLATGVQNMKTLTFKNLLAATALLTSSFFSVNLWAASKSDALQAFEQLKKIEGHHTNLSGQLTFQAQEIRRSDLNLVTIREYKVNCNDLDITVKDINGDVNNIFVTLENPHGKSVGILLDSVDKIINSSDKLLIHSYSNDTDESEKLVYRSTNQVDIKLDQNGKLSRIEVLSLDTKREYEIYLFKTLTKSYLSSGVCTAK